MPEPTPRSKSDAPSSDAVASPTVDTLFFDGQCPLCASEIAQLRKTRGDDLALVDIHDLPESSVTADDSTPMPDRDTLLRTLHLQKGSGEWLLGADANVAAWEGTRHGRLLSVLRWPVLRLPVDLVYRLWAQWRYRRLYGAGDSEGSRAAP